MQAKGVVRQHSQSTMAPHALTADATSSDTATLSVPTTGGTGPATFSTTTMSVSGPVRMDSISPIYSDPIAQSGVTINLCGGSGPEFARRWHKLPDELKVRVLEFNLILPTPDEMEPINAHVLAKRAKECVLPYLRMTPEIAALAKECFYATNDFHLRAPSISYSKITKPWGSHFMYPPRTVNHLIRRVTCFAVLEKYSWSFLQNLAKGTYGFSKLQHAKVVVMVPELRNKSGMNIAFLRSQTNKYWVDNNITEKVIFSCKGELEFRHHHRSRTKTVSMTVEPDTEGWRIMKSMIEETVLFNSGE
ncbi:hypothetical protein CC80DRAFT_490806 [Byssothecium circinans]|uniref:Uncharacterized protein n=1 Tax=Byssothecium circinans TaxID=147558 RepID=A0A6A5TZV7_9PLEO|nr:hypothetical protein CC80DRAFT_490806 [Byssothecium circinans]